MLLILTICTVFTGLLIQNRQAALEKHIQIQAQSVRAISETIEEQKSSRYRKRIQSLINYTTSPSRKKMLDAFARKDRQEMLELAQPFLQTLKKESPYFSTFGWVLPDNRAFLRVHSPQSFGEDVSKMRPDIVAANKNKRQYAGFTAGYNGVQYRIVQPVSYEGQHIGTIQFGLKDSMIIDAIQKKLSMPVGLVIANEKFRFIKKSQLPSFSCCESFTVQSRDAALFKDQENNFDWSKTQQRMVLQGKEYVIIKTLPLLNFNSEKEADIFVALDISGEVSQMRSLMIYSLTLSAILLLASFLILYSSYGSLVQKIVNLNRSLEESNVELEDRVRERTAALQQQMEERKIAEQERAIAEAKAQRASKMEAIGLMAGGVAHDLNNILSGIVSYPELLLLQVDKESKLRAPIEAMRDSGMRAATIVADLLTVARGVASDKLPTNLNTLVKEYLDSPECRKTRSKHPHVKSELNLSDDLFNISCSPVHIKKCLMNLINNGIEAISDQGTITISTRNQYVDKPVARNQYMEKGEYVVLSVSDTGSGIAQEDLDHIFEPFYTKKKMGRSGTGLGLAIVWNTVHDHGGAVTTDSNENGTRFELYFPITRDEVVAPRESADLEDLKGKGELILIIDDEAQQRDIAGKVLTSLGYRIHTASSGEEAVSYLQDNQADLLLLDMIMDPGINGHMTYEKILAFRPHQKAIIASGFSEDEEVKKTQKLGASQFIRKPYTLHQLGTAVKKALAA